MDRGVYLSQDRDYNHATDKEYENFRRLADQAYQKRSQLSQQSQKAYKSGDKARAHDLSMRAKQQLEIAEGYNAQAANYVFIENNEDSDRDEIDLHGLYVKEAEYIVKQRVSSAVQRGETHLKVIVGKGKHSQNGVAKLKPAIQELCDEANLRNYIDKHNSGVLVIELAGARIPASWASAIQQPQQPQPAYQGQQQPVYGFNQGQNQNFQGNQYHQQQQTQNNGQSDACNIVIQIVKMLCKVLG